MVNVALMNYNSLRFETDMFNFNIIILHCTTATVAAVEYTLLQFDFNQFLSSKLQVVRWFVGSLGLEDDCLV